MVALFGQGFDSPRLHKSAYKVQRTKTRPDISQVSFLFNLLSKQFHSFQQKFMFVKQANLPC
jgi:hypothetical protein